MEKNEIIFEGSKSEDKYKNIICPECKENAKIVINNYKIGFSGCKNGHIINDILINDFEATQFINEKKLFVKIATK